LDDDNLANAWEITAAGSTTSLTRQLHLAASKYKKSMFKNVWIDHDGHVKANHITKKKYYHIKSFTDLEKIVTTLQKEVNNQFPH
jgi:hypothetical protein